MKFCLSFFCIAFMLSVGPDPTIEIKTAGSRDMHGDRLGTRLGNKLL